MRIKVDQWSPSSTAVGDNRDVDFWTEIDAPCDGHIRFDGIATIADIRLDGELVATSRSMWVPVTFPITAGRHRIDVHCAALEPLLAVPRSPRARWRQSLGANGNLRWFRTSLLGRTPGLSPAPPIVGLWRPAWFIADEATIRIRTRIEANDGIISLKSDLADGTLVEVGGVATRVAAGAAELRIRDVERWWPHSYGEPTLYDVNIDGVVQRRVGFRTIESPGDIRRDGLRPRINGVDVFVRGAVWTPTDDSELRVILTTARDHGLNALRIPGTTVYESPEFYDLCSELGLLVWQDLMFANFDYPFDDAEFRGLVEEEVEEVCNLVGGRPSLFCLCGGSEVEQQAEMLGLPPALARHDLFDKDIPAKLAAEGVDALWVPNAPCGAERALRSDDGVANWFGVGGYRRPLAEARRTLIKFASECLALSNVGDSLNDPESSEWKAGIPRDSGADWDFEDVRNHYLQELFGCDADTLRASDPQQWLQRSKEVSARVMTEVLGEWRRPQHPCAGAFILRLRDDVPGPGWGLIDSEGQPKFALRALRDVIAPVAIWITDERTDGYAVQVANDRPTQLSGQLVVSVRQQGRTLYSAEETISVAPRGHFTRDVEAALGRWVDVSYAYRFGPPAHDEVRADLIIDGQPTPLIARRFPAPWRSAV